MAKWVTLTKGREHTGHGTNAALKQFCRRWNDKHPGMLISRRPGYVDMDSLAAAIKAEAETYTPGLAGIRAASALITKTRRPRANGNAANKEVRN